MCTHVREGEPVLSIDGNTRLVGLLADPIAQVRTPSALNPLLASRGANMIVVPLHVAADGLEAALSGLRQVCSFTGFLASVPHKQNIPALCDIIEASARQVGAANSVRRQADGKLVCATFDGQGFVSGLKSQMIDPSGMRVLLAGAGGAASAVAYALAKSGISELAITNRTQEKSAALAAGVGAEYPGVSAYSAGPEATGFDLVVNATSLGMRPGDALPVDLASLAPSMIVAEVIMVPEMTPLLQHAQKIGARVHGGQHMLSGQLNSIADFLLADSGHEETPAPKSQGLPHAAN